MILKRIIKTRLESVNWVSPAQNRDKWNDPVITVMKLRVPQGSEDFLARWGTIDLSKGLCSVQLAIYLLISLFSQSLS
jgi:hypothetical protein